MKTWYYWLIYIILSYPINYCLLRLINSPYLIHHIEPMPERVQAIYFLLSPVFVILDVILLIVLLIVNMAISLEFLFQ